MLWGGMKSVVKKKAKKKPLARTSSTTNSDYHLPGVVVPKLMHITGFNCVHLQKATTHHPSEKSEEEIESLANKAFNHYSFNEEISMQDTYDILKLLKSHPFYLEFKKASPWDFLIDKDALFFSGFLSEKIKSFEYKSKNADLLEQQKLNEDTKILLRQVGMLIVFYTFEKRLSPKDLKKLKK